MPPSTMRTWPEICPETFWDERMTIWFATSSGVATFFNGVLQIETKIHPISTRSRGNRGVARILTLPAPGTRRPGSSGTPRP